MTKKVFKFLVGLFKGWGIQEYMTGVILISWGLILVKGGDFGWKLPGSDFHPFLGRLAGDSALGWFFLVFGVLFITPPKMNPVYYLLRGLIWALQNIGKKYRKNHD